MENCFSAVLLVLWRLGYENGDKMAMKLRFYVNSWGRAKIEKLEIVSECESSGTIFMYYRTEFFS